MISRVDILLEVEGKQSQAWRRGSSNGRDCVPTCSTEGVSLSQNAAVLFPNSPKQDLCSLFFLLHLPAMLALIKRAHFPKGFVFTYERLEKSL